MHKLNLKMTVAIDPKSARVTTISNGHNINPSQDSRPLVALPNLRTAKRILSNPKFGMVVVQTNSLNQFKTTQHGKLVPDKQTYATNAHPLNIMGVLATRPLLQTFETETNLPVEPLTRLFPTKNSTF